ncbi:MAG: CHAT domain-containing protein [Gammaproteobacteria bacterium]
MNLGATGRIDAAALAMFRSFSGTAAVSAEGRVELSQQLYRLIIEPLPPAARRARVQTFVADGALHYVPFAALASIAKPTPRFLIDEHDVAVTPSLGALAHCGGAARRRFAKDMLLIADPVYSTADARLGAPGRVEPLVAAPASQLAIERISRAVPGGITRGKSPARLPGAEQEASAIAGLFASDRLDRLEGFDASRDAFLARDLTSYRYIHIAAHGVGDARSPKFSELVLSTVNRQGQRYPAKCSLATSLSGEWTLKSSCSAPAKRRSVPRRRGRGCSGCDTPLMLAAPGL